MKITNELLRKLNACDDARIKFRNTPELHKIDIENLVEITTTDDSLFCDIKWLLINARNHFKLRKLKWNGVDRGTEIEYDERGNKIKHITSSTISDPVTEEWTYDDNNKVLTNTRNNFVYKKNIYDENGNRICETPGGIYKYTYDERGNELSCQHPDGYLSEYTYDENNNRLTYKDSLGSGYECTYNEQGQQATYTCYYNGNNKCKTTYTYDERGNLLKYEDSDGRKEEYTYDDNNQVITHLKNNGDLIKKTYDEDGILLTITTNGILSEKININNIQYDLVGFEYK
jgi:YD repeat-containing protein